MPDHAALVAILVVERPLCMGCLAAKSGLTAADLDAAIESIEKALILHRPVGRCRACGIIEATLSVDHPAV
jgi:hypothetical protein